MQNFNKKIETVHIETMGCRLNQIESEGIADVFLKSGFGVSMKNVSAATAEDDRFLLCIVNTCAVTQKSEQKARRIIRLLLKLFPRSCILITGCYAQLSAKELELMDSRICVVGGQVKSRISKIPQMLASAVSDGSFSPVEFAVKVKNEISLIPQIKSGFPENSFSLAASAFLAHSRPSLKIQDGCNSNCSYCAIHLARGHSVSLEADVAVQRVLELEKKGYAEVVLTSVNICQYKSFYDGNELNFSKLLNLLLEKTEKINFRISSIYPQLIDDEFCNVIKNPRVRPHFHLSVQSGSDKILSLMSRSYTSRDVVRACEKLREAKNDCFIACDIITGFPGETEEDFNQTLNLCRECDFTWIHAFPFSLRPGTYACSLKDKVPQSVSGERAKKLNEFAIENKIKYLNGYVSKEMTAIPETIKNPLVQASENSVFLYHAVTANFIHCAIKSREKLDLKFEVKIKITKVLSEKITKGGDIEVEAELL